MEKLAQRAGHRFNVENLLQPLTVVLALAGLTMLAVAASGQAYSEADLRIAEWIQGLSLPGFDLIAGTVNFLTDGPMAITLWVLAMAVFSVKGRPVEAIAMFLICGLWMANELFGRIVDRPAAPPQIDALVDISRVEGGSFPSGHVTGAVVFYGLLTVIALANKPRGKLHFAVPALAAFMIGVTSISRVYAGAHWPTDVLGSYLVGFMGLAGIAWFYMNVRNDTLSIPKPGKQHATPDPVDGIEVAGSIASKVYLDRKAGTATKEYNPPFAVRALYWLAFQAPFPYSNRRDALDAAAAKRKVAGLLTKHRFGYDMVAAVHGIEERGDKYRFVTELVSGVEPSSNEEVAGLLSDVYEFFDETGLPTWQIAPGNPHAYSNFIRQPDGQLRLIDLESALISSTSSFRQFRAAMRDGLFPVFDDVDFVKLNDYVSANASQLTATLGEEGLRELRMAAAEAAIHSESWRGSERRVWGRIGSWVYRRLDFSGVINWVQEKTRGAEVVAKNFLDAGVDRWEREGLIDSQRAADLRANMGNSEVNQVLRHMGAHMVLSVAIVVPIPGLRSLARFSWTLGMRLQARVGLLRGRITSEEYAKARAIHSVPVMLIALIPAFGAAAYAASSPVRTTGLAKVLADSVARKLPFKLYRRLRLARVTTPTISSDVEVITPVQPTTPRRDLGRSPVSVPTRVIWPVPVAPTTGLPMPSHQPVLVGRELVRAGHVPGSNRLARPRSPTGRPAGTCGV